MTPSETATILRELKSAYPRMDISRETFVVYAANLAPFDAQDVTDAVRQLIRETRFFPTIAEILETLSENTQQLPTAMEAWAEVLSEVRRVGSSGARFSCQIVCDAVGEIGFKRIGNSMNIVSERARFIERFNQLREKEIKKVQTKALSSAPTLELLA